MSLALLALISLSSFVDARNPTSRAATPPNAQLASDEFEQADNAWSTCVESAIRDAPVMQYTEAAIAKIIPTICGDEAQREKRAIRQLVDLSPSKKPEFDGSRAFEDRLSVLAQKLATKLNERTIPASVAPIPVMKGSVSKGLAAFNAGDYETALARWLPKAKAGDPVAQNNLGVLFENGYSVHTPRNDNEAAAWYILSARQGFVDAMQNLARVQSRLGHSESAASWLAMATSVQQQRIYNQQQTQAALGYALGCAIAGGCRTNSAPIYRAPAPTSASVASRPPVSLPPLPVIQSPRPTTCRLSEWMEDANGMPKIVCQ